MTSFRGAVCALALVWLWSSHAIAQTWIHDTDLSFDSEWHRGQSASLFVRATIAKSIDESVLVDGAKIAAWLQPLDAKGKTLPRRIALINAVAPNGSANLSIVVPDEAVGDYKLHVETSSPHGRDIASGQVRILDDYALTLRTDRGVYKPGQHLHWRVSVLHAGNAHAVTGKEVQVKIIDSHGTAIWTGTATTNEWGVASGDLPLSEDLRLGRYTVRAGLGDFRTRESFVVRQFKLPAFAVEIEQPDPASLRTGSKFVFKVIARHHFGEPVMGQAKVNVYGRVKVAQLDSKGQASFEATMPRWGMRIRATVSDGAGRKEKATVNIPGAGEQELAVVLIAERKVLLPSQDNWFTVVTSDFKGVLAPANIRITGAKLNQPIINQSPGALRIALPIGESGRTEVLVAASTKEGLIGSTEVNLDVASAPQHLEVDEVIITSGETIRFRGDWRQTETPVIVTLLRHGTAIASKRVVVDSKGKLRGSLKAPLGVFGLATLRISDLAWDASSGALTPLTGQINVFLQPKELVVEATGVKRLAPGETTEIAVSVKDDRGQPVEGAGLSASIVDERIIAMAEDLPSLIEVLRNLDVDQARESGLVFVETLRHDDLAHRLAARALLETLPLVSVAPKVIVQASSRLIGERARLAEAYPLMVKQLVEKSGALGKYEGSKWVMSQAAHLHLEKIGWSRAEVVTPWNEPTSWAYATRVLPTFAPIAITEHVANLRLDRLVRYLRHNKGIANKVRRGRTNTVGYLGSLEFLRIDPWGTEPRLVLQSDRFKSINLVSAGPDRQFDTPDDLFRVDVYRNRPGEQSHGLGFGGMHSRRMKAPSVRIGNAGAKATSVRKRFDETALWAIGVRTNKQGKATLEVEMPDSITGWRIDIEALDGRGGIGALRQHVETFAKDFTQVQLPAQMSVGDRLSAPVIIQNHSGQATEYQVSYQVSGAAELAGDSEKKLHLDEGDSRMLPMELIGKAPGEATIEITLASGGRVVDRLERKLSVVSVGQLVRHSQTRQVKLQSDSMAFEVPTDIDGAASAKLVFMRSLSDEALDGLGSLLREPHGCFEQTSSTTYPNLLVLDLLPKTAHTAAQRSSAKALVAKGYQRLISYEVNGGGYSWFGEAPANQALTAYGLMQFVDMAKVYGVDPKVIERTRDWLKSKQKANGSWSPDAVWLHDWSQVEGVVSLTAYVTWSLAEAGERGKTVKRGLGFLRRHRDRLMGNPYLLGLWANAEVLAGNARLPLRVLQRQVQLREDGERAMLAASKSTLFYSTGKDADIQVTALAAMAFERSGKGGLARGLRNWLGAQRSSTGGWGTTQSTVLALRAQSLASKPEPLRGALSLQLDGQHYGTADLASTELLSFDLDDLSPGTHRVHWVSNADRQISGTLRWQWRSRERLRKNTRGLEVGLQTPKRLLRPGEQAIMKVTLRNPSTEIIALPTLEVPVPPGFRVDQDFLDRAKKRGQIRRYEDLGTVLNIYLEQLAGSGTRTIPYGLIAEAECRVTQHAVTGYAYYSPGLRGNSDTTILQVRRSSKQQVTARLAPMR